MTETDYLLVCVMEECNEVSQRVSKALRFGLGEIQPGQGKTNAARIREEVYDLHGALEALMRHLEDRDADERILDDLDFDANSPECSAAIEAKIVKIREYLDHSEILGLVTKRSLRDEPPYGHSITPDLPYPGVCSECGKRTVMPAMIQHPCTVVGGPTGLSDDDRKFTVPDLEVGKCSSCGTCHFDAETDLQIREAMDIHIARKTATVGGG